jgi:hypothetical protein
MWQVRERVAYDQLVYILRSAFEPQRFLLRASTVVRLYKRLIQRWYLAIESWEARVGVNTNVAPATRTYHRESETRPRRVMVDGRGTRSESDDAQRAPKTRGIRKSRLDR